MSTNSLLVIDWTQGVPRIGVFRATDGGKLSFELSMRARVVLKNERSNLCVFSGEAATAIEESLDTIIIENPATILSKTDDPELVRLLVDGFWSSLTERLSAKDELKTDQFDTYVVTPQNFSIAVLESVQAGSRIHPSLRLLGCIQEAAALVIGAVRALDFTQYDGAHSGITVGLAVAGDEQTIDVACFDYARMSPKRQKILIRDCFQTRCSDLPARLHECDWLGAFSQLVIVEDPELPDAFRNAVEWPFRVIAGSEMIRREMFPSTSRLKMMGAAHFGLCAGKLAPDDQEYEIATVWNLGLQIDPQYFQPILTKEASSASTKSTTFAAHAFVLDGRPDQSLRLNFFAGYSRWVADAIALGHTVLSREELDQLNENNALTASASIDGLGGGEFRIGVMPGNRLLRREVFTLPGLIT